MSTHTAEARKWDVFVSYSRADRQKASVIVDALNGRGLRVFVDDTSVDDFASITGTITAALARSKVLIALYSTDYPHRRACQWELTYAYLAGQREGDPRRRVLVVNPEGTADHVHPLELRDARHFPWPSSAEATAELAVRIASRVSALDSPMGNAGEASFVPWLPAPARTGSVRFIDRLAEQWHIHSALHGHRTPLVAQGGSGRAAQLQGMPGIGKSLLAQEYALRFSPAFDGGIFWFDLHESQGSDRSRVMESYASQITTVLTALGKDPETDSLPALLSLLAVILGERNRPCLWVVDGLPDGLPEEQLHLLRGPHLLCATLITTRSQRYASFAEAISVPPLPDHDAMHLLTSRREPRDEADHAAAAALVRDVAGHPRALDVLADLAASSDFTRVRNRLHAPETDLLARATAPSAKDTDRDRTLAQALLPRPLTEHGPVEDVLRMLALASPAPLAQTSLENALAALAPYDPWESAELVTEAIDTLLGTGALHRDPVRDRSWTVHPLLARTVRRHDSDNARQEDVRRALLRDIATPAATAASPFGVSASRTLPLPTADARRTALLPSRAERAAAFDLQVELVTRVGIQPLEPGQGSLREALASLHSLFGTTRALLRRVAAEAGPPTALPPIASRLLNQHLRPFLSTWHPALDAYEAERTSGSATEHERNWERAPEMRDELTALREPLTALAKELASVCGVDLAPASPPTSR